MEIVRISQSDDKFVLSSFIVWCKEVLGDFSLRRL